MSIDLRPLSPNATQQTIHEVLQDQALRAEILWTFIILLHFAALIPLNPVVVHLFVVLLDWAAQKVHPSSEQRFYTSLSARLSLDSSTGLRGI